MKALSVVGTRPEVVMAFPVSRAVRAAHEGVLVHTGQHYDEELSAVFFEELGIADPEYPLDAACDDSPLRMGSLLGDLRAVVDRENPDAILVYGDTDSALAGAVAGAEREPAVVHVEAGLRSGDPSMPEERNRVLIDHLSDACLAPTAEAVRTLAEEGVTAHVSLVGDTVRDALAWTRTTAARRSTALDDLGLEEGEFVLATVHRAGNTDDRSRLDAIVDGLAASPKPVVFPAHPRTVRRLEEFDLLATARAELQVVDPVGYLDFVHLLDAADRVATDSGGVQQEAFYLGTPCVTMRDRTEWTGTVERGANVLVGADGAAIREALSTEWHSGTGGAATVEVSVADRIVEAVEAVVADRTVSESERGVAGSHEGEIGAIGGGGVGSGTSEMGEEGGNRASAPGSGRLPREP